MKNFCGAREISRSCYAKTMFFLGGTRKLGTTRKTFLAYHLHGGCRKICLSEIRLAKNRVAATSVARYRVRHFLTLYTSIFLITVRLIKRPRGGPCPEALRTHPQKAVISGIFPVTFNSDSLRRIAIKNDRENHEKKQKN